MMATFLIFGIALLLNLALGAYHFIHQRRLARTISDAATVPPHRQPYRISGIVWAVLLLLLQLFLTVWAARNLIQNDLLWVFEINVVLIFGTQFLLRLPLLFAYFHTTKKFSRILAHPLIVTIVLLLLASCFSKFSLEFPSNIVELFSFGHVIEYLLIAIGIFGLFFLFQRRGDAPSVFVVVIAVIGIAEYFLVLFKSMPLQPGDLLALSTAAAVAANFTFELSRACLFGMSFGVLAIVCCMLAGVLQSARQSGQEQLASSETSPKRVPYTRRQRTCNLAVGLVCLVVLVGNVFVVDYYNTLGIQVGAWDPLSSYRSNGFLPSFISSAQSIIPTEPDDYDTDTAIELLEAYAEAYDEDDSMGSSEERAEAVAQFDEEQPTVIVIMNETFADLSIYQNLRADYDGPEYFNSISNALAKGSLYVSVFGAGTSNTEFEVLTGNSMAFIGQGVYPYTIYNLSSTENLARQFKELGYSTIAIHPNHATNWNREIVYEDLGFDVFYSIDDYQDADTLRYYVTDEAIYDSILEMLEEDDDPQFVFTVTMQNHSGYETGLLSEDMLTNYVVDDENADDWFNSMLNEYLTLIEESDRALEEFLAELEQLDRDVVVVFFGDHQPSLAAYFTWWWYSDESDESQTQRKWQTPYMIWANYDVAGNSQTSEEVDISANYLGAYLMEIIGAPLTDYQKAQLSLRETLLAVTAAGYQDSSGAWHITSSDDDATISDAQMDALEALADLEMIQYYKLFDHEGSVFATRQQSAANVTNPNA